ncbi:MAG: hypothetical protein LBU43_00340 [Candidatus Accumulibacter sp.]|jgi:hypothetical protein|nr:hypothetical protein [Accumulibacter sp.]
MGLNREQPHLVIYPEDSATKDLADSFKYFSKILKIRPEQLTVKPPAKGWSNALDRARNDDQLGRFPKRNVLLLIDLDTRSERIERILDEINDSHAVADRFFVVGWQGNIEQLKSKECSGRGFDKLAEKMANDAVDCRGIWEDRCFEQMRSAGQYERLRGLLKMLAVQL